MNEIGNYIRKLRKEKGLTQEQLGEMIGVKKAAVQKWENGSVQNLKRATIKKLSDIFNVSPVTFVKESDEPNYEPSNVSCIIDSSLIYQIPVFESVSAGFGAYANSDIIDYIPIVIKNSYDVNDTIAIKVTGDSMYPKIEDGDLVVVRRQTSVDSGDIAVVMIDGEEWVVKRVVYGNDWIELQSINPEFKPRYFEGAEVQRLYVAGKVMQIIKTL